ncbi:LPS export ABC transporter permease LptG [Ferrovibrio sp.]|uniref:LPS export ABC transporter permease LptG n=1 Tax=Ferrovibrio sp. TaxID=1917215 RepID=UPI0025BE7D71|nr:LPS export ABC transporter permease LptG [Ferrovibrio sp.]MBX3456374.1 LPS export ABC transporter permease LptG [Ferrovibrio sp.]
MRISWTLAYYLGRQYLMAIAVVFSVLVVLAYSFDTVELLRRASGRVDASLDTVFAMSLLRLPNLSIKLIPFAALFGGMLALSRLTRSQELTVTRAAGVSVWQFLAPALILALLIGGFVITVYNPLSAAMLARYEAIEAKVLRGRASMLAVSSTGLWLREADAQGQVVVHALRVAQQGVELRDVILFYYEGTDRFVRRVDASEAYLRDGYWELRDATTSYPDRAGETAAIMRIPTTLTFDRIQESFASPSTISFWQLPSFIAAMETAGFSALRHRLHFQTLLAVPLLLCAMLLIAASFSLRLTRRGGTGALLGLGVGVGFLLYFSIELVQPFGLNGTLPVGLAAWAPTGICLMLGISLLFHMEDG